MKLLFVAGTRPNFVKLAPLIHSAKSYSSFEIKICHTGQHFDFNMSDSFWQSLDIPTPNFNLHISGQGVSDTIGKSIIGISDVLKHEQFDGIVVFGDVNATVAGAIAGAQSGIKVIHVEAGLRSFDRRMPEEINRVITDHISDFLFVSEKSGLLNLSNEGISNDKIHFVGNIMIESLIKTKEKWEKIKLLNEIENFIEKDFMLATFHRPENVDNEMTLKRVCTIINEMANHFRIVLPLHPRTKANLIKFEMLEYVNGNHNILVCEPLPYFEFLNLMQKSTCLITDSGGIQEETSYLGKPCITFRNNTERPITIEEGTNKLLDLFECKFASIILDHIESVAKRKALEISYWDGNVSNRILNVLAHDLGINP